MSERSQTLGAGSPKSSLYEFLQNGRTGNTTSDYRQFCTTWATVLTQNQAMSVTESVPNIHTDNN